MGFACSLASVPGRCMQNFTLYANFLVRDVLQGKSVVTKSGRLIDKKCTYVYLHFPPFKYIDSSTYLIRRIINIIM
jgi:hypothetical protein